jgi:hypothetical protein
MNPAAKLKMFTIKYANTTAIRRQVRNLGFLIN